MTTLTHDSVIKKLVRWWPWALGIGIGLAGFGPWSPDGFTTYFLPVLALIYLVFGAARGHLSRPGMLSLQFVGLLVFGLLAVVALLADPAVGRYVVSAAGSRTPCGTYTEKARRGLLMWFGIAAVVSIPLLAPVAIDRWHTWAWVAGSIAGSMPLLRVRRAPAIAVTVATFAVNAGIAWWAGKSVLGYTWRAASLALTVAGMSFVYIWLWDLLRQAEEGRAAQARLAATEERLRFARDVHWPPTR